MFLLYIKISYEPGVCHDFDPRLFGQIEGHWKKMFIICARYIINVSYEESFNVLTLIYTKIAYDLRFCHDFDQISFWWINIGRSYFIF